MPAVQPAKLQEYEVGLKELLARHGLDGKQQVDSLSLTEVVVDVTTLLSVEFEVERERQERNLTAGLWRSSHIDSPLLLAQPARAENIDAC